MNKHISLSLIVGLVAGSSIAAFQPSANAASFSFNAQDAIGAGCVGQTTCTVKSFFSVTANTTRNSAPPLLTTKTIGGIQGIGIDSSNPKNGETAPNQSVGEIDIDETLNVGFKSVGVLKSLDLSFLYRPSVYGDEVYEIALVRADDGLGSGTLKVTSPNSAVWSLGGIVTNLSLSSKDNGGSYRISDPFGDVKIKGFSLTAVQAKDKDGKTIPVGAKNSDFDLSRVEVTKVPEPTTVLSLGVVGLLAFARRRNELKAD